MVDVLREQEGGVEVRHVARLPAVRPEGELGEALRLPDRVEDADVRLQVEAVVAVGGALGLS